MSRHSRYVLDNSDRYIWSGNTTSVGNKMFHRLGDMEFIWQVDMLRDMGKDWNEIDTMFEITFGRARRLYKRICASYGIKDRHHYRHCLSY